MKKKLQNIMKRTDFNINNEKLNKYIFFYIFIITNNN